MAGYIRNNIGQSKVKIQSIDNSNSNFNMVQKDQVLVTCQYVMMSSPMLFHRQLTIS